VVAQSAVQQQEQQAGDDDEVAGEAGGVYSPGEQVGDAEHRQQPGERPDHGDQAAGGARRRARCPQERHPDREVPGGALVGEVHHGRSGQRRAVAGAGGGGEDAGHRQPDLPDAEKAERNADAVESPGAARARLPALVLGTADGLVR
jgi:hypothetical protein